MFPRFEAEPYLLVGKEPRILSLFGVSGRGILGKAPPRRPTMSKVRTVGMKRPYGSSTKSRLFTRNVKKGSHIESAEKTVAHVRIISAPPVSLDITVNAAPYDGYSYRVSR
jgi:hypothetical protein